MSRCAIMILMYFAAHHSFAQVSWSTLMGGSGSDYLKNVVYDPFGNIYVSGVVMSGNMPLQDAGGGAYFQGINNGGKDLYIAKFSAGRQLVWATYLGGSNDDFNGESGFGQCMAVDLQGNLYIGGYTTSTNLPVVATDTAAYFQDTIRGGVEPFIARFDSSGKLDWCTYFGGSTDDIITVIDVDLQGNLLVCGSASSPDMPVADPGGGAYYQSANAGDYDLYLARFAPSGQMVSCTYYGGSMMDDFHGFSEDDSGNLFLLGMTQSADFPLLDPAGGAFFQSAYQGGMWDGFAVKLTSSGVRQWSTYFGGDGMDMILAASSRQGEVLFAIQTTSTNLPVVNPGGGAYCDSTGNGGDDIFIAMLSPGLSVGWGTYVGGLSNEAVYGIDADMAGNIWMTGETYSSNFPTTVPGGNPYYQSSRSGLSDAFILGFGGNLSLDYATYLGGGNREIGWGINAEVDILVTGETRSTNFPAVNYSGGYYQSVPGGINDGFLFSMSNLFLSVPGGRSLPAGVRLHIYPNPAAEEIFVSLQGAPDIREAFICDPAGRKITEITPSSFTKEFILPLENYPSGMYYLYVSTSQGAGAKPFAVAR